MATDTIHTTTCPTAVALAAPTKQSAAYVTARRHNCLISAATLPTNVKVTTTAGVVPTRN
jgi:hypothetical protein